MNKKDDFVYETEEEKIRFSGYEREEPYGDDKFGGIEKPKFEEIDDYFEVGKEIKEKLSLKGYIYLVNEYIELMAKIKNLQEKNEDKFSKLKQIRTTINVLKENNIKIPEELSFIYSSLCKELSFYYEYFKLLDDIRAIVSINNLRYLIDDIADKEKLSLESISLVIGCERNTLDNLVHRTHEIKKSDIQKFIDYYGIKQIIDYWNGRYVYD